MSKKVLYITFPIILVFGIYFMGPEPERPVWSMDVAEVPAEPAALERYVADQESKHKLKPDNEARIVWADSSRRQTEYSVIYLHGFSASQEEGDPVHRRFARTFGCNLYLARMADHGVDTTDQLLYFTADRWWKSSKEALAIGKSLGRKVIVMSTSTGGTMALILAAAFPQDVFALINMSPNIAINDPLAGLANNPWGLQLARLVKGGNLLTANLEPDVDTTLYGQYWNRRYRVESGCQLQEMLEDKMNRSTFERVKQPCLTLYYFKNEQEQDATVKVSAMLSMHDMLGTPDTLKAAVPIPDAGGHVLGSPVKSKDIESVSREARKFAVEKLRMTPVHE